MLSTVTLLALFSSICAINGNTSFLDLFLDKWFWSIRRMLIYFDAIVSRCSKNYTVINATVWGYTTFVEDPNSHFSFRRTWLNKVKTSLFSETVTVLIPLKNPLQVPLTLSNISLHCLHSPRDPNHPIKQSKLCSENGEVSTMRNSW